MIQVVISGCDCCKPIPTTERDVNEGIVGVPLGIYDSKMMAKDGWWRGLVGSHPARMGSWRGLDWVFIDSFDSARL